MTEGRKLVKRAVMILLFLVVVGAAAYHAVSHAGYLVDDAFITFRFAENLAAGRGLCYNPPERVEGYSNFLLVLLLALGHSFGVPCVVLSQLLGVTCFLALIVLLFVEAERVDGAGPAALVAPALLASSAAVAYWAVAGLETLLYTLLLTASVVLVSRPESARGGQRALSLLVLLLLALCRTEGSAPAGLLALWWAGKTTEGPLRRRLVAGFLFILPLLVGLVAFHCFRFTHFGTLSSATALAKWRGSIAPLHDGGRYVAAFVIEYLPTLVILALAYAVLHPVARTVPFVVVAAFQVTMVVAMSGDWMPMYRMFVPLIPLAALETGRTLRRLARIVRPLRPALALAIVVTMVRLTYFPVPQFFKVVMGRNMGRLFHEVAEHLKEHFPPETAVAIGDIGRVGWETGFRILDLKGLVSPWISETYRVVAEDDHRRVSLDVEKVLARKPRVVLVAIEKRARPDGPLDDGRFRGFWSCDTDLLKSTTLSAQWKLEHIFKGGSSPVAYLLFVRKSD